MSWWVLEDPWKKKKQKWNNVPCMMSSMTPQVQNFCPLSIFFSNSFHKLDVNWKVLMFSKGPVKSIRWLIRATTSIACHQNGLIVACTQGWSLTTTPCDPLWECTTSKQKEIFSNGFRHLTCKRCENDYMKGFFSASSQSFFIVKKPSGVPKNGHPCPSEG